MANVNNTPVLTINDYAKENFCQFTPNVLASLKVSYMKKWDSEGTTYSQMLSVTMSRGDFNRMNYIIATYRLNYPHNHDKIYLDTFKSGDNYTTLTMKKFFCDHWGLSTNKKIKDRNTIIRIRII